jgi:hypothetical protein
MGLLVNESIVCFLDDDNWFEPTHVADHFKNLVQNHVSYSLRNIYTDDKQFLCQDNCESLGDWPVWNGRTYGHQNADHYHMDTSAYAFRREFLVSFGHHWYGGYGQDRQFWRIVRELKKNGCMAETTGKYTLNYRLGSTETSASADFFKVGNQVTKQEWDPHGGYPWVK